jgi:hypothetical protein
MAENASFGEAGIGHIARIAHPATESVAAVCYSESVDQEYQATTKLFWVNQEYQADLKVFLVNQEHQAKWAKGHKLQSRL